MRIVSGDFKGRTIPVRKDFPSRPTTDFAKENIFNVLHNHFDFEEIEVLDLFSGTGSISFEFASRVAIKVTSVELNYQSFDFIRTTAKNLEMQNLFAVKADAFRFIEKCTETYDIVFADPPYDLKALDMLPEKVFQKGLLKPEGWFILEHGKRNNFNSHPKFFEMRNYGSVCFSIFRQTE